jgi:energy-coupling factor transport system permease protein
VRYNSLAWLAWAVSAAVLALLIRNPFYLLIIALCAWLVYSTAEQRTGLVQSWRGLLKLGVLVWVLAIPFNALMVHLGTYVLFRLPPNWPLVGGNITLEAVLYGLVSGLALWVLLLIFTAFNVTVDASQLLRLAPPFLYQAGVVTSIAVTFMPQMLASAKEIREAQQIRGHRFRGWRDMLPLLIPLLTTGFERAVQLAESMESRGFGGQLSGVTQRQSNRLRLLMLLGLALLLCGLFFYTYWPQAPLTGILLMLCAGLILVYTFWALGRHVQRSHYRRSHWRAGDTAIVLSSVLVCVAIVAIRNTDKLALVYYPYPPYTLLPDFSPWIGLALMGLAVPGLLHLFSKSQKTLTRPIEADAAKDAL